MLTLRKVAVGIKYAVDEGACLRYYGTVSNAVAAGKTRGSLLASKPACLSALEPTWRAGTDRADYEELVAEYSEMVDHLAGFVDHFLCETMGACFEARAASDAARTAGKPVWVSFTLQGGDGAHLLDGTSFAEACSSIDADAFLLNCSSPEQIFDALPDAIDGLVKFQVALLHGHQRLLLV